MATSYSTFQTLFFFYYIYSGPQELFVSVCIRLPIIGIGIYPYFVLSLSIVRIEAILYFYFHK